MPSLTQVLEGRTALITGAGGGIGQAAAHLFARNGAAVAVLDIDADRADAVAASIRADGGAALGIGVDVRSAAAVRDGVARAENELGPLDCALNNAGVTGPLASVLDATDVDFDHVLDVNVRGTWNCLRAELPGMLRRGRGSIVNMSSGLGVVASPNMAPYVASKHAVFGLTRAAALEYSAAGVRVNAILPGVIDTTMPRDLTTDAPEVYEAMRRSHPMGRFGRADEIARAALWLVSDASSFVTGHGLAVDGGHLAQ